MLMTESSQMSNESPNPRPAAYMMTSTPILNRGSSQRGNSPGGLRGNNLPSASDVMSIPSSAIPSIPIRGFDSRNLLISSYTRVLEDNSNVNLEYSQRIRNLVDPVSNSSAIDANIGIIRNVPVILESPSSHTASENQGEQGRILTEQEASYKDCTIE
jgi:hypothetical protein